MAKCPSCEGPDGVLLLFNVAPCDKCDELEKRKKNPVVAAPAKQQSPVKYVTKIFDNGKVPSSIVKNYYWNAYSFMSLRDDDRELIDSVIANGGLVLKQFRSPDGLLYSAYKSDKSYYVLADFFHRDYDILVKNDPTAHPFVLCIVEVS